MKMRVLFVLSLFLLCSEELKSQQLTRFLVLKALDSTSISGVTVLLNNKPIATTDSTGIVVFNINEGINFIGFSAEGFASQEVSVSFSSVEVQVIYLMEQAEKLEDVIIVSSTRSNQSIENAPIKVEVLDAEEMKEESMVKPANVLGIIGDISGVQVQQISAVSGSSNIRIQGLEGRYTQILRDGMPLYEGFSGNFGLMSIPPLDLKQAELIKGSSSTLYGGGAIGGMVNLISKKPTQQQEAIVSINQTTLQETDINSFLSERKNRFGYTLYLGGTTQSAVDVNKDGFSDLPQLRSMVFHPRLFYYPNSATTFTLECSYTKENRLGGDMFVIQNQKDAVHQYFEKNQTERMTVAFLAERKIGSHVTIAWKSSLSQFLNSISSTLSLLKAKQTDFFSELSYLINRRQNIWVTGLNVTGNQFVKVSGDPIYLKNSRNQTLGLFSQFSRKFGSRSSFELGIRNDYQNQYGNFFLPRVALYHQLSAITGIRLGYGAGYKIPNALSTQLIDYSIQNLLPISPSIVAEKSNGYNLEVNFKRKWNGGNEVFLNQSFFLTQLNRPLIATQQANGQVEFSNAQKPIVSKGLDTYIKLRWRDWELYTGITYTIAERKYLEESQFMPLTPKYKMAFMLTREWEGKVRFCIESTYTGFQYRMDYTKTPDYLFLAGMVAYDFNKHLTAVFNVENLLDVRQSRFEPLYSGSITNPVFSPLWAPVDGRVFNLSFKLQL